MQSKSNHVTTTRAKKRRALACKNKSKIRRTIVRAVLSTNNNNIKQIYFNIKFAIRYPKYSDFHSIKQFLLQLFLKAKVDLPDMSSELIKQSNISIVIKQAFDSVKCKDNLNTSYNQVFGISSIINITQQRSESIANVHNLMLILSEKHGDNGTMQFVNKLLSDDKNQVGFLINERYLNIPPSISGPLFQIICKELSNKRTENPLNNFAYLFMICKLYKVEKSKKGNIYVEGSQILWRNAEEQFFDIVADYKFEYCVQSENCTDPAGKWVEFNNSRMIPFRRVLIFSMNKFFLVTKKLESLSAPKVIKRHSAYSPD